MRRLSLSNKVFSLILIIPAILVITFVIFYPMGQAIVFSFSDYNIIKPDSNVFNNFENFKKIFSDRLFIQSLKNTAIIVPLTVVGGFILGLAFALVLNQKIVFRNFFRGIGMIPWVIPYVVVSMFVLFFFNHDYGVVNQVLKSLHIITDNIPWFAQVISARFVVIAGHVFGQFPFYMLMYLAALQTIPNDIIEAANIDGPNLFQRFFHITIPYLKNVIMITTTLMVIWNFNSFDIIWITTKGGPANATQTIGIYVYKMAFEQFNFGYAAALGVFWLVLLFIFAYVYLRIIGRSSFER